jgi:hypothetical protein
MTENEPQNEPYVGPDGVVWACRLLGFIVIGLGLAIAVRVAVISDEHEEDFVWYALQVLATPLGLGFLILVAAEILNSLRNG